jgi:hypothetical protein
VRRIVEDAGLIYIDEVYIGDFVRALDICMASLEEKPKLTVLITLLEKQRH